MTEAAAFLQNAGWGEAAVEPIASDASDRRYCRLRRDDDQSAILMHAPVSTSELAARQFEAFRRVSDWLRVAGFAAPSELAADRANGLLLLEDLGTAQLSRLLISGDAAAVSAYGEATRVLSDIATLEAPDWMARPDAASLTAMAELTFSHLPGSEALAAGMRSTLHDALSGLGDHPAVSLRDVHGDNLIWRPDAPPPRRIGLLDFQDALVLPDGYDLASLLDDPRRVVPETWRRDLIIAYATARGMDHGEMALRIDLLSLQRNLRVLGIFRKLTVVDGRPRYARFLPRTRTLLQRAANHDDLAAFRPLVAELLERTSHWQAEAA